MRATGATGARALPNLAGSRGTSLTHRTTKRALPMVTMIALIEETQHGEENIYDTVARAARFEELAQSFGATVKALYWTLGSYDGV